MQIIRILRGVAVGLVVSIGLACQAATVTIVESRTLALSGGYLGDSMNTVMALNAGGNAKLQKVEWSATLEALPPSWLSEMKFAIYLHSPSDALDLGATTTTETHGVESVAGSLDLVALGTAFDLGADGFIRVEFFEDYDDLPGDVDGYWRDISLRLTFDVPIAGTAPLPGSLALVGLAMLALGLHGRVGRIAYRSTSIARGVRQVCRLAAFGTIGLLATMAHAQESEVIFKSTFARDPFPATDGKPTALKRFGRDVTHNLDAGSILISQNLTDTYARVETHRFYPAVKVKVEMDHTMQPGLAPQYFFPGVVFVLKDGRAIQFLWLRSAYASDYCNLPGGYDKVIAKFSGPGPCTAAVAPIASSLMFSQPVKSTVEVDMASRLVYFRTVVSVPAGQEYSHTFTIPSGFDSQIVGVNFSGYGWYTGHRHEFRDLTISAVFDPTLPTNPLGTGPGTGDPDAFEGAAVTSPDLVNFAGKSSYWSLPLAGTLDYVNHQGTDLAASPGGALTVGSSNSGRPVRALCDGTIKLINQSTDPAQSFIKVYHPSCGGRTLHAYYGHAVKGIGYSEGSSLRKGEVFARVQDWGSNSHLHLTLDAHPTRALERVQYVLCNFTMNAAMEVTSFSSCRAAAKGTPVTAGTALLRMGWGRVYVTQHFALDAAGPSASNDTAIGPFLKGVRLYIRPEAMSNSPDPVFKFVSFPQLMGL